MVSLSIICVVSLIFGLLIYQVQSQLCYGSQYDRCSPNNACACFLSAGAGPGVGVCAFQWSDCSSLSSCDPFNNHCYQPEHVCVHHPRCQSVAVCYPVSMMNAQVCPPTTATNMTTLSTTTYTTTASMNTTNSSQLVIPNLPVNATWVQQGVTVAGGNRDGWYNNQLSYPHGLFVDDDDDQTIVIADYRNHRIMQWKRDDAQGQVVAGGYGEANRTDQLNYPSDVLIDIQTKSLIITDYVNRRVIRWSRRSGTTQGEILIENIVCYGLTMDEHRYLYVSDIDKQEVRRYEIDRGDKTGTVVAGGNGSGDSLNQLDHPTYLLVDRNQSLYVSDTENHRVMKWNKGAAEGVVVAGGQGYGSGLTQLSGPKGIFVDTLGTLYVTDYGNHRVTRWPQGSEKKGTMVVGGNGEGSSANQFNGPIGLSFDKHGNLYVADAYNHRVQRFNIIK